MSTTKSPSYGGWRAKAVRNAVLKRDGIAKSKSGAYEVHHIIPRSQLGVEKWYDEKYCIALPKEEHKVLHKMESELRAIREERDELLKVDLYAAFIAELEVKI
jgi:5-methylcytosine-specific restriction endonuclease McrA